MTNYILHDYDQTHQVHFKKFEVSWAYRVLYKDEVLLPFTPITHQEVLEATADLIWNHNWKRHKIY